MRHQRASGSVDQEWAKPRQRAGLDWWGMAKGSALGGLLGAAAVGVILMPAVAAMVGVGVAIALTGLVMVLGGAVAEIGRRMWVVSTGQLGCWRKALGIGQQKRRET
jgi:hypothetical protein